MAERVEPFHSFTFTLIADKQPRASLRMTSKGDGFYELHVEKGSAANPTSQFTRTMPFESAERLRDALQNIGVFGWEESYGDASAPGSRRWNVSIVFKEGVFSVASKGGSDAPTGFDDMLEELYRLDFPRPKTAQGAGSSLWGAGPTAQGAGPSSQGAMPGMGSMLNSLGMGSIGRMSVGDLGAYAATGGKDFDFSQMADALQGGMPGFDAAELQSLMAQAQTNPQLIQQRMREEYRHMTPAEQEQLLDALAASGLATREWWKRFLQ